MKQVLQLLDERVARLIEERGWTRLTEIQVKAIPEILAGKNVIITAPTGYGKTEAAILPILSMMLREGAEPVALLYVTPMRALINDLYERIGWWASRLGLRIARKHGDVSQAERSRRLRQVPHILITTPESLEIDLDWATRFREYYRNVKWVVVDEVHEIIGTKRGVQLAILLSRLRRLAGDFQLVLISATVGNPMRVLEVYSFGSRRERAVVTVSKRKRIDVIIDVVGSGDQGYWKRAAEKIARYIEPVTLIFVNSKYAAERLHEELTKIGVKDVMVHHASLSTEERLAAEKALREGRVTAVICTKTLELGIDIGEVKKVILFRPPGTVFSLVQRLGRSGHRYDVDVISGVVVANDAMEALYSAALVKAAVEGRIEEPRIPEKPLDVLVKALIGMALQQPVSLDEAYSIFKSTWHYRSLTREEFMEVVKTLVDNGLLQLEGNSVRVGPTFYKIWRFERDVEKRAWWVKSFTSFFSTIGDKSTYTVKTEDGRVVGELDAEYVSKLYPGAVIRLGGRNWLILLIDELAMKIVVREERSSTAVVPIWRGMGPEASRSALEALDEVLKLVVEGGAEALTWVRLSDDAKKAIEALVEEYRRSRKPLPSRSYVVIEQIGDEIVILGLMGEAAARALGYTLLYAGRSFDATIKTSYYGVSVKATPGFNPLDVISRIEPEELPSILEEAVVKTPYYLNTLREVRISFGQISKMGLEDNIVRREAIRQAIMEYFDVEEAARVLRLLREGRVRVSAVGGASLLARMLVQMPEEKLWKVEVEREIAEALKGMAFTVEELASMTGLPEKILEAKLREMRKPGSPFRVFQFIDVDTGDWRWALEEDVEEIVKSEEFANSFKPLNLDEHFVVMVRGMNNEDFAHVLTSAREVLKETEEFLKRVPFNEIYELKVIPLTDESKTGVPRYYYVSKRVLPYLVLNAIAVIQRLRAPDIF